mgnify:CR=1 FL=1
MNKLDYKSPIGIVEIVGTEEVVSSIMFIEGDEVSNTVNSETPQVLVDCSIQLDEYFKGERHVFSFPYNFEGTEFQKKVWKELIKIPYGETRSYKEIAKAIGNENASRAVGNANNKNKLAIVIPCHRVIGKDGGLGGYSYGLNKKDYLLKLEKF